MAKMTFDNQSGNSRRERGKDAAAKRAGSIQKRANEEFLSEEYDEYDYDRSTKVANRGCLIATLAVIIVVALVLFFGFMMVKGEVDGKNATAEGNVAVEIPSGAGGQTVAGILKDDGLIGNELIYRLYSRFNGTGGNYRSGTFELTGGMSYDEILDILTAPVESRETTKITFVEGETVWMFAQACEKAEVCTAEEFILAANDIANFEDIEFLKHVSFDPDTYMKAEGYLAPNTYEVYVDESPASIARRLFSQNNTLVETMTFQTSEGEKGFYEMLEFQNRQMPEGSTFGMREAFALASMVEEEASDQGEDKAMVAGVFWNRLTKDISGTGLGGRTLGSDVTVYYVRETIARDYGYDENSIPENLRYAYLCLDNAESREGLPVGPVTNPSQWSLEAALQPAPHDYFFFVTDLYGTYYYSRTYNEHLQKVAEADAMNVQFRAENGIAEPEADTSEG